MKFFLSYMPEGRPRLEKGFLLFLVPAAASGEQFLPEAARALRLVEGKCNMLLGKGFWLVGRVLAARENVFWLVERSE